MNAIERPDAARDVDSEHLKGLFAGFESLGDNCEFGIAQRLAGTEPLGLFRFTGTPHLPSLTCAIDTGFETFGTPDDVRLFGEEGGTFGVHIRSFSVIYATPIPWSTEKAQTVLKKEIDKIRVLKRRFLEDLADARKIFVRKGRGDTLASIQALSAAMRRHGPNTLFWVTEADRDHPAGSVEFLSEGIITGRIAAFAPTDNVPSVHLPNWISLCERCWDIVQRRYPMS